MKDLNEKYKNGFDKLELSCEDEKNIKQQIFNRYTKYKKQRKVIVYSVIVTFVCFTSLGIVHADEITDTIKTIASKVTSKSPDGTEVYHKFKIDPETEKKINYDAELEEPKCIRLIEPSLNLDHYSECYGIYNYEAIEEALGIKLLKSNLFKEKKMLLRYYGKNEDDKITYLEFVVPNIFQANTSKENGYLKGRGMYANWSIIIQTKYLDRSSPLRELAIDEEDELSQYYIENLNTSASILNWSQGRYFNDKRYVVLEYDDVIYKTEINALDNSETIDQDIKNLLDSLSY